MANISLNAESETYFRKTKYSFEGDGKAEFKPLEFQSIGNLKNYYKNPDIPLAKRQNEINVLRKVKGFQLSQELQEKLQVRKSDKNIML